MIGRDPPDTKWIVFIDALDPTDIDALDDDAFLSQTHSGTVESGVPRVTPRIAGSMWTGDDPAVHGLPSLSRFNQQSRMRPATPTLMESVSQQTDLDVLVLDLPFASNLNLADGSAWFNSGMLGQPAQGQPQQLMAQMNVAGPAGDLIGEDPDYAIDAGLDYTHGVFETARQLQTQVGFDVVFIGYRRIDSYCHHQYPRGRPNGEMADLGDRYRDELVEAVSEECAILDELGDCIWFSDHGSTKLTHTFRINRWLKDNGYLKYEIDHQFANKAQAVEQHQQRQQGQQQGPSGSRVENAITPGNDPVTLDMDSFAICGDPFDAGITILNEDAGDREQLKADLEATPYIRACYDRDEQFDPDGSLIEEAPDILPDRAEGVFVSGNVHPEAVGMGWYREGVHYRQGVFGTSGNPEPDALIPEEVYDWMAEFLDFDPVDDPDLADMNKQQLLQQKRQHKSMKNKIDKALRGA